MQAIDKVSVVQQAVEQLKTYISSNDLEVGQKLPTEKELCAQLAIGRGSLREALRILAATSATRPRCLRHAHQRRQSRQRRDQLV